MNYIYILSLIALFIEFLCINKCKEKQDIILWICIGLFTLMVYNSIIIYGYSIFSIKSTLLLRTITDIVIGILLYVFLLHNKEKQKYKFNYKNLIICLIIVICSIITINARYTDNLNVNFETTDPSVHYLAADLFAESNILIEKAQINTIYGNFENGKTLFFSYTNLGTLFQVTSPIIGKEKMYLIFVLFESIMWIIGAIIFYYSIISKKMTIINYIFSGIIVLLYMHAYPLNNLIFGFHYLGLGVIIINIMFLLFNNFFEEELFESKFWYVLISVLAFSVFSSYYLFVPLAFGGCGLFVLYQWLVRKKIKLNLAIKIIIITLVIPFVLGFCNYILPGLIKGGAEESISPFVSEGYIYRNLLGNFIYLLPIAIYMIINDIKEKKNNAYLFGFIMSILYIIVVLIMGMNGKSGSYYYFKLYFPAWLFMFILIGKSVNFQKSLFSKVYVLSYSLIIIMMIFSLETKVTEKNYLFNPSSFSNTITDVYWFNNFKIEEKNYNLTKSEIELVYYVKDNYDKFKNENGEIPFMSDLLKKLWIYSMTRIIPINHYSTLGNFYDEIPNLDIIKNDETFEYIIVFYRDVWYSSNKDNLDDFDIIYSNDGGVILKKNVVKE